MLALNYGDWTYWEAYDPLNGFLGLQKVTFDGPNKLILVNEGETELDFRIDVYGAWKEWLTDPNRVNAKYAPAISVIGGDPLPGARALGTTFFLINGWRMRTWNGDHTLTIVGNVYTREGDPVFVPTTEKVTTTINLITSTLVETLIPTVTLSNNDIISVAAGVWDKSLADHTTVGSAGKAISDIANTTNQVANTVGSIPTTPAPDANAVADAVWTSNTGVQVASDTSKILKLEEADEELSSGTATKYDKDTGDPLLVKVVTGVPPSNTVIRTTSP